MAPGGNEALARTSRNLVVALTFAVVAVVLYLGRILPQRDAVLAVAGGSAFLLATSVAFAWWQGSRGGAWCAALGGLVLSRSTLFIVTRQVFAVRDAITHVLGLSLAIVERGHLPTTATYSSYPVLHVLLASLRLLSGADQWDLSFLLALVITVATAGLVGRAMQIAFPRGAVLACVGFAVAPLASSPGQFYQPLTLAMLDFAAMALLLTRARHRHLDQTMFFVVLAMLALTHPYSANVIGVVVLMSALVLTPLRRDTRFVIQMAVCFALALIYLAYVGGDLPKFLNLVHPAAKTVVPGFGPAPVATHTSFAYRFVETWKFRLPMAAALAGFVLAFWLRPRTAVALQVLLASCGLFYLVALNASFLFPTRVLELSAIALAPMIGWALHRSPIPVALVATVAMAVLAGTSVYATAHLSPWAGHAPTSRPLDNPPESADAIAFFAGLEGGSLVASNPVSSHPMFHGSQVLDVRAFNGLHVPGTAPKSYYFYRDDAATYGFSFTKVSTVEAPYGFSPFPTTGNLDLLASIDRIGDFGSIQVYRN